MKYGYHLLLLLSFLFSNSLIIAQTHKTQSVLRDGQVFKIGITETGVHRLTYEWMQEQLGVNPSDWNADNIQVFGNGGGRLPEANITDRIDDLQENAIQVVDGGDGQLNAGDYILFYAENQDKVYYSEEEKMWLTQKNVFDTKNYYFLKIGNAKGKRIETQENLTGATYSSSSFDDFIHFEEDKMNLLDEFDHAQGSGKRWYGDQFKNVKSYDYEFTFSDLITTEEVKIKTRLAARARQSRRFTIDVNGQSLQSNLIGSTSGSFNEPAESIYANIGTIKSSFTAENDRIKLKVTYQGEEAWLDYITLNARRVLKLEDTQVRFSDEKSLEQEKSGFQLESSKEATIWDISNPMEVKSQIFERNGNTYTFAYESQLLKRFVAFAANEVAEPAYIQGIENQNLHALQETELLLIYPTEFEVEAKRLAEHRRNYSGLQVETVLIDQIFHEFSSGRQDPTAIRDFVRMLHLRDANFKYLLLFGDGSFDYRNIKNRGSNFITVYETDRSEDPIDAFPSDDYFGLLDDEEGSSLRGDLDVAIGRLPVKTVSEARQMVDKIMRYDLNENAMGDWRNRVAFVADDEDNNLHIKDTDFISKTFRNAQPKFNQEKIYFDAFEQQSTSGGQGFPDVTDALNQTLFKGVLAINYLGHGGSQGWAQERVLDKNRGDIKKLDNRDRLPVFVTATCSFSGYDDPNQVTGGEEVLLNPNGGGIALFTTVRAVYASSNAALVRSVFDTMFHLVNGKRPTLGHIMRTAKNASSVGRSTNSRKFTLLGDPSQPLALPIKKVETTSISSDTLRAFQKVTITGEVQNLDGTLANDFNGDLTASIFDKTIAYTTLAQDSGSKPYTFDLQKNVIFKGRASITKGQFEITFVMPKDINFEFGKGRISYYAKDASAMEDASGVYEEIIIGGADEEALADQEGPKIELFLEDESFVFGGTTGNSPLLIVKLQDDNGINVSGNSIGHDLEAVLDENTQNTFLLNDFYEAALNDYTKGTAFFPLKDLEEGLHRIEVKAWDIANNSSKTYTEFVVATDEQSALTDVLTFPNPFSESTCFEFKHNFSNQELDIQIQIYNVAGRLEKVIEERIFADGNVVEGANCIRWDGRNESGGDLAKGLYLYQIKVRPVGEDRLGESSFEKLVILK